MIMSEGSINAFIPFIIYRAPFIHKTNRLYH